MLLRAARMLSFMCLRVGDDGVDEEVFAVAAIGCQAADTFHQ